MTDAEITLEVAKFDEPNHAWEITPEGVVGYRHPTHTGWIYSKPYLFSRDAIIPAIEKLDDSAIATVCMVVIADRTQRRGFRLLLASPRLLCVGLLRALLVVKG